MTRIKTALMGSVALALAGTTAAVAGSPASAPVDPVIVQPVVPVQRDADWTGFYFGSSLGAGNWDLGAASGDGRTESAFMGYDYDFGDYVVGGEVQYSGHNKVGLGADRLRSTTKAKLRLGYDAGSVLVYGTAGYGYADTSAGGTGGYVAGVGIDYKMHNNIAVGAEYLYHDLGSVGGNTLKGSSLEARISYRF